MVNTLASSHVGQIYYVDRVLGADAAKLRDLGLTTDKELVLLSTDGENSIIRVENTRLAISKNYLNQIFIKNERSNEMTVSLASLEVGQTGIVRMIDGMGEVKRRLMDMGITRGTEIYIRKLAPLGDPMELHLRGYSLSLRKVDAGKIKVVPKEIKKVVIK